MSLPAPSIFLLLLRPLTPFSAIASTIDPDIYFLRMYLRSPLSRSRPPRTPSPRNHSIYTLLRILATSICFLPCGAQEANGACFRTRCGHLFCESCAFQHFGASQACAACGASLEEADISELNLGLAPSHYEKIVFQAREPVGACMPCFAASRPGSLLPVGRGSHAPWCARCSRYENCVSGRT